MYGTNLLSAPAVYADRYYARVGADNYQGTSGQITWVDDSGVSPVGHSLVIKNGLIVGMS